VRRPRPDRLVAPGLAALAFAVALLQRPGVETADTKIGLQIDPSAFLSNVFSAWSPTEDLGHVQGGQYSGYLWPMGPFFALLRGIGLSPWLVDRLWLGVLLALAAWGTVRLLDAMLGRPGPAALSVAGVLMLLNPYVTVFTARTTVTLLGYAALPWLLLCVHRGLRAPRSWWWPAAFALLVTSTGGGVNAAVTGWILLAPLLLALYERFFGGVPWRALWSAGWRTVLLTGLVSLWWVVPLLVQSRYGVDFLRFTEQPGTIWSTTSLSESLRLMGYWISYLGVGFGGSLRPLIGGGGVLLFDWPVVVAGLAVPALALAGFLFARRFRYGPFFLLLALAGALVMTGGFPEGTPLRKAMNFTYNHVAAVQFLRTTYKAGPLLALGLACLAGAATPAAVAWLRRRSRWAPYAGLVAGAVLVGVAAWPLVRGQAIDSQLTYDRIPAAWESAAKYVDRTAGRNGRAVVLPGQLYAYSDWGGTVDHVLPALAKRPVAVRYAVPYADLRAVDLLWTVDALVQQRRALPGQLNALLDLLSARVAVSGSDDDRSRSGAVTAADAADVLDRGLGDATAEWGPARKRDRAAGTLGAARRLPQVRAWDRRDGVRPLVRVESVQGTTVVDGSADALAGLAAMRQLPATGVLAYAADLSAKELQQAAPGGEVVISDSNRRRVQAAARMTQNQGATLAAGEDFSADAAVVDPFAGAGTAAETVAVYGGARYLRAPYSPAYPQFPERRPYAAFDGDPATHWQADRALEEPRRWLEIGFTEPRDVAAVDLLPYDDRRGKVTAVEIGGRRYPIHQGWNHLQLGLKDVSALRVRLAAVTHPKGVSVGGGIRELQIPGVNVTEALRPPQLAEKALAGRDLRTTGLTYLFQRTTGDDPFRRDPRRGTANADLVRDRLDGETGIERIIHPPETRRWLVDGWATVAPDARDSAIDDIAGLRDPAGGVIQSRMDSSGRFQGRAGFRASSAFDGTSAPWIGSWLDGRTAWLTWTTPAPVTLRRLRLAPAHELVRRPTRVRLRWDGHGSRPLDVGRDGTVELPTPARGTRFRLEILRAAFPAGTSGAARQRRAVGIREIVGEGIPRVEVPRTGVLQGRCGDATATLGGRPVLLRPAGTRRDLDAGHPLRLRSCGVGLKIPGGEQRFSMPAGTFAPYLVRLRSEAIARLAPPDEPGRVTSSGKPGRDAWHDVKLDLTAPAWLVLGQSFSDGWRASCDGDDLGSPLPVDGYAMGWQVPRSCRDVDFVFGPDRLVKLGYALSLIVALVLAVLLVARRRPRPVLASPPVELPPREPVHGMAPHKAMAIALAAGAVLGFVFAARSAPFIALGLFLVLWRGFSDGELTAAAGALLLVVVPVLTLAIGPENRGGYNPEYPMDLIAVHWVAVAAVIALMLALVRVLGAARRPPPPG
jgi:arabinofuranan 3-O-arabinosyltransferase